MKKTGLLVILISLIPFAPAHAEGPHCKGRTTPGNTNWKAYGDYGVYLDIDTSECGFTKTPLYFTTLRGNSWHWRTTGVNSIYRETPTGFRIYLRSRGGKISPSIVNAKQWHIDWIAYPKNVALTDLCTGQTGQGTTAWKKSENGIWVDIDTSACPDSPTSFIHTSLSGSSQHWQVTGVTSTSIYERQDNGFRIHLYSTSGSLSPEFANARNWRINWVKITESEFLEHIFIKHSGQGRWKPYNSRGIYLDLSIPWEDSVSCSLGGENGHWRTTGVTSLYPTSSGQTRIYIYNEDGDLSPEIANELKWGVDCAIRRPGPAVQPMAWINYDNYWIPASYAPDANCTRESTNLLDQISYGGENGSGYCHVLVNGYEWHFKDVDSIRTRLWNPSYPTEQNRIGQTWTASYWDQEEWRWRNWYFAEPPKANALDWAGQDDIFYKLREWGDISNWDFKKSYYQVPKDNFDLDACLEQCEDADFLLGCVNDCYSLPQPICYPISRYGFSFDCAGDESCVGIYEIWGCMLSFWQGPWHPGSDRCSGCDEAAAEFLAF